MSDDSSIALAPPPGGARAPAETEPDSELVEAAADETIARRILETLDRYGADPCFRFFRGARLRDVSYRHFRRQTLRFAGALGNIAAPGDRLVLWAETSPEWMVVFLGAQLAGLVPVPLSRCLADRMAREALNATGARLALLGPTEASRLAGWRDRVPALETVIRHPVPAPESDPEATTRDADETEKPTLLSLADLTSQRLDAAGVERVRRVAEALRPEDPALLLPTIVRRASDLDETAPTSGALFDHGARFASIDATLAWLRPVDEDVAFTVLPFDEPPSLEFSLACFAAGVPNVLGRERRILIEEVQQASPSFLLAPPEALERAYEEVIVESLRRLPESSQEMFEWALATGKQLRAAGAAASDELRERAARADRTFFSRIRGAFGGRFRQFFSTGAALPRELAESIAAIGLQATNVYSVPEAGGFPAVNPADARRMDAVGPAAEGYEIRLGELNEILVRGAPIAKQVGHAPHGPDLRIDDDGWLHTGDHGRLDDDGHLLLTGRGGGGFLLSSGREVDPGHLEELLEDSPLIEHAAVFGPGRPYVIALLVPDLEELAERVGAFDAAVAEASPPGDGETALEGAAAEGPEPGGEPSASSARGETPSPPPQLTHLSSELETLEGETMQGLPWYWTAPHESDDESDGPEHVVTQAHPRVRELIDSVLAGINLRLDRREQIRGYCLIGRRASGEADRLVDAREHGRRQIGQRFAEPIRELYPRVFEASSREITRVEVGPERLRELLEKETILDAWAADAGMEFLFDLARRHQIDAPSVVHICDTAASVAQMEAEEKPLSTALIVGDPVRIHRVLPGSLVQLHRFEHIRRMRSRLVDLATMVDGRVLGYVVDRHGFVRGICRLDIALPHDDDPILGPQFRLHAHVSDRCDALVFFVPQGGRQVRVFARGQLVGRYSHGDWAPETSDRIDAALERMTEKRAWDAQLVRRLLRCAFRMSEENLGAIFLLGDADAVLAKSDAPDISHFAWIASTPVAQLSDEELIVFAKQDGATVIDAATGRFRGCMILLRPDAATTADIGPGKGARHSSAAKMSAELGALAITVSQDGPITVYDGGRRILAL